MKAKLPKHLEDVLKKREEKFKKFGTDPDFMAKAYKKAEKKRKRI